MHIGFIGLGNLGTVMVDNLIDSGTNLHLYNRTKEKLKPFEGKANLHDNIVSLTQIGDLVISIVSDDEALKSIALGEQGLVNNMKEGSIHVCLSTIAPATASLMDKEHKQKGIDYITATIIGRPDAAKAKNLTVCVSGYSEKKEKVIEILKALGGKNIYQFGQDPRTAAVVKVCNNFLIIAAIEAMGETFNLAEKGGVDKEMFYQMITDTIFSCPIYKNYGKIIIDESYDKAGFTSQLGLKDTKLALGLADEVGTPLPLADLIKNHFYTNHNRGRASYDWTSIVKVIQEESTKH